ncbi:MAG: hypothetical protein WBP53_15785 [Dokdonella sp.]
MSYVRVSDENLPRAHAFLCSVLIDGRKDPEIGEQDAVELRRIGLFAPADAMPQTVAYQFPVRDPANADTSCTRSALEGPKGQATHPGSLRLPAEWPEQALRFEPHHHGSVWAPVRLAGSTEQVGDPAGVCSDAWQPGTVLDVEATHAHFAIEGFAILEDLLPAEHVEELARYFQAVAAQGFLPCDEVRGARRHYAYNHPVANFWHHQLNERVSQLAGRPTKPSYSFVSLYLAGGDLLWHTDRPPCEYTVAVLLDYAPLDSDGRSPWGFKLKGRDGEDHSLHQRLGEALIFRGRELMHGRDVLPDGHRSASLLFHFVNEDYEGDLE